MNKIEIYDNIPYQMSEEDTNQPFLTPYLVDTNNKSCMLIFPGGGYSCLAPHEGEGYAKWFNSLGINAFVLNYRLAPYHYPCQMLDARRAVRYIKSNAEKFNIDPDKIVIIGSSAGGHLAATTACYAGVSAIDEAEGKDKIDALSVSVAGLILCYPVISCVNYPIQWCIDNLLGDKHEYYEKMSIELSAGDDMPPAFVWSTFTDNTVDIRNSLLFAQKYKELGLDCELHIFPFGCHGLGLAEDKKDVSQWPSLCKIWLESHGFMN